MYGSIESREERERERVYVYVGMRVITLIYKISLFAI
jgi:hypothetical protein